MEWGLAALNLLPFLLLLVLIAILPLIPATAAWWEKPRNKMWVCLACALTGAVLGLGPTHDFSRPTQVFMEYLDFLALLTVLFTLSGGIHIGGAVQGFPWVNIFLLLIGALLSNVLGTAGASMLLIRPLLAANRHRRHKTHILLFFILIVSNCASCLIPLGPPLYLGYLGGVPFLWTLHLLPPCALVVGFLLVLFHFYDEWIFEKEEVESRGRMAREISKASKKIHVQGWMNMILLALVIATILFTGYLLEPTLASALGGEKAGALCQVFRAIVFAGLAWLSFRKTPRVVHAKNQFHFAPLQEVAVLFLGIFGAMVPALSLMEAKASAIPLTAPWQYFWASGLLSAFLDNAPTYLNFTVLAAGQNGIAPGHLGELADKFPKLLGAISCGASFMGALTYIGNGPNLMVKAIAEHHRVKMPSFGGYMLWAGAVLVPVFILVTFIFFV